MRLTAEAVELRKSLLPFLGMFMCDTGGTLNRVVHFYHYRDFSDRDAHRAAAAASSPWQDGYLASCRSCVERLESSIYVPAVGVMSAGRAVPIQAYQSPPRQQQQQPGAPPQLYEMRQYQVGYGCV